MRQLWTRLSRQRFLVVVAAVAAGAFPLVLSGVSAAGPPGPSAGLDAVSCTSGSGCIAVGEGHAFTVAERWNGTKWTAMAMPRLSGSQGALLGIACISASNCIAVGRYTSLTLGYLTLAEHWNGTAWTVMPTPGLIGTSWRGLRPSLAGVSCVGASNCLAVGAVFVSAPTPHNVPLVERWNGTKWRLIKGPAPIGLLNRVICMGASNCIAVGSAVDHWNGTAWTVMPTPIPAGEQTVGFTDITCISASNCTVVGASDRPAGALTPLAEHWNGTAWTVMPTPIPQSQSGGSSFSGIACTSASNCTAVGSLEDANYVFVPMAEHWNGTNWTIMSTPTIQTSRDPQGSTAAAFTDVACPLASTCVAVAAGRLFTATWNGGGWKFP